MTSPTREQKVHAVFTAVRKEIAAAVQHGVGLDAETVAKIDRLLGAGQRELESGRMPVVPPAPVVSPPEPGAVIAHPRFQV